MVTRSARSSASSSHQYINHPSLARSLPLNTDLPSHQTSDHLMDVYGFSSPDFFRIDDLLDFSNDDLFSSNAATSSTSSSSFQPQTQFHNHCPSSSASFPPNSLPTDFTHDLCLPNDDAAQLEWLSQFVDDSFRDYPENPFGGTMNVRSDMSFPGRARSKRSKATGTGAPASSRGWASAMETEAPATARSRMKKEAGGNRQTSPAPEGELRRCTHCASEKTPQWRTGPLGPKTLCNACGVRFKSGRLVPEYRPASSPTFVLTQHSNSHRKVMELRRQKEMMRHQHLQIMQQQPYQPQ